MSYDTALIELRQLLADTDKHKRASMKAVLGQVDGTNTRFRTYDKRIVAKTFKAYVGTTEVSASIDDAVAGEFVLSSAPTSNQKVAASYYWQWFLDSELKTFLNKGAESTGQWTDSVPDNAYLSILPGLKNPALHYAAALSLESQIFYLSTRRHSAEFVIEEDGNTDSNDAAMIDSMRRQVTQMIEKADKMRDDFWDRQGKKLRPAFAVKTVAGRQYGPQR